ncbi:hypothetical protein ABK040_006880 [Willaertia magna]
MNINFKVIATFNVLLLLTISLYSQVLKPNLANFNLEQDQLFCTRSLNVTLAEADRVVIDNPLKCSSTAQPPASSASSNVAFENLSFYVSGRGLLGLSGVNTTQQVGILDFLSFRSLVIYNSTGGSDTITIGPSNLLSVIYLNESTSVNYGSKLIQQSQATPTENYRVVYVTQTFSTAIGSVTIVSVLTEALASASVNVTLATGLESKIDTNFKVLPASIVSFLTIDNLDLSSVIPATASLDGVYLILDHTLISLSSNNISALVSTKQDIDLPYTSNDKRQVIKIASGDPSIPNSFVSIPKSAVLGQSTSAVPQILQASDLDVTVAGITTSPLSEQQSDIQNLQLAENLNLPNGTNISFYKIFVNTALAPIVQSIQQNPGASNFLAVGPIYLGVQEEARSSCQCSADQQQQPTSSPQPAP